MYTTPFLPKLTAIMVNCVERLKEAYEELNNSSDANINLISTSGVGQKKKDRRNDDEDFVPTFKSISKGSNWQKNNGKSNEELDMKMMLRKKLLKIRPKPPVNAFISYVQAQKDRIAQENPKKSIAQITSIASKEWKDLPQQVKQPYIDDYQNRQKQYRIVQEKFILENPQFKTLSKSIKSRSRKSIKMRYELSDQIDDLENIHQISSDSGSSDQSQDDEEEDQDEESSQQSLSPQSCSASKELSDKKQEEQGNSDSLIVDDEI